MLFTAGLFLVLSTLAAPPSGGVAAQADRSLAPQSLRPGDQPVDEEYTRLIEQHLLDPRITTELVDHLPSSTTVPTPLDFFGRIVGTPGELTYAKDIHRYYETLAKASPRARFWKIGITEEGRDIVVLAIADEPTIAALENYRDMLRALTDARKTSDAQAQELLRTAKPIYHLVSGMHSTENGGPEMLIELAYRLIVQETPFIRAIRSNVITFITPVIEVDGREKQVDTYYFNKKRAQGEPRLPLVYWGKYVAHDNNRDGMGQFLKLTQAMTEVTLTWHPTIVHDLHEARNYLYTSTGTGPYNESLDPITVSEWWTLAQNDVLEMTKRGVPGVWTYGFYDGWVPNYMIFIAHSHNAVGRFYEVQSYGPDPYDVRPDAASLSREWFRPNPPLPFMRWGPRNNTNIQQSAVLLSLQHVARNRDVYVENYWLKNKRSVEKGRTGPVFAWVVPARQKRKSDAAIAVNDLRRQGLEISRAAAPFTAGGVSVQAGDYIVRADQPFRTLADMYFSLQYYAPQNPAPYDDTGWTFQLMRDLRIASVTDNGILGEKMTLVTEDVKAPGSGVSGRGRVLIVEHTGDTNLAAFRFRNASIRMQAAEAEFEAAGRRFPAGSIIIRDADRAKLAPALAELGLSAWAVDEAPAIDTHELDVPRIGYVHSWVRTQDEGWWRAAFDTYGIPYTYFADQKLREGGLRSKFDVIVFPHVGGTAVAQVNGIARTGSAPLPYKKSDATPNLGAIDSSDDIRGGMGLEGLAELARFVQEGGTLVTEGSTAIIFPQYGLTTGVMVEDPSQLFVRGSILRGRIVDGRSPIAYGFDRTDLPVYFSQAPVLSVAGARGASPAPANPNAGLGQIVTPNASPQPLSPFDAAGEQQDGPDRSRTGDRPDETRGAAERSPSRGADAVRDRAENDAAARRARPRVVIQFPADPKDMLLSGTLANGQLLANRAAVVDQPHGEGHVVMFAIRPFWRWQTHGTYTLGFNALMHWNDLDAGRP
jgi:hypothetical protein